MTTFHAENLAEAEARGIKAAKLAHHLRSLYVTADEAAEFTKSGRELAAKWVGVRMPSETTWATVVGILRADEA